MRSKNTEKGFSLLELMVVMGIVMVMAGFATITLMTSVRSTRVDTAYQTTMMELRMARQQAIDTRDVFKVDFVTPGTMTITHMYSNGTTQFFNTVSLPPDISFQILSGQVPTVATGSKPTPDSV